MYKIANNKPLKLFTSLWKREIILQPNALHFNVALTQQIPRVNDIEIIIISTSIDNEKKMWRRSNSTKRSTSNI